MIGPTLPRSADRNVAPAPESRAFMRGEGFKVGAPGFIRGMAFKGDNILDTQTNQAYSGFV